MNAKLSPIPSRRPKQSSPPHSKPAKGLGIIILFMFVVGMGVLSWGGYEASRAMTSIRWPSTEGTVIRSFVQEVEHHKEERTESTFYPKVVYRYSVFGESREADRIAFGGVPGGSRTEAQRMIDRYPVGMVVTVFYDPNRPSVAVLKAGYSRMAYMMVGVGVMLIAGAAFGFRRWRNQRGKANLN